MSDSSKFIKAITTGYAYTIVNLLVSLWLLPYVLQFLTRSEYAIFAILTDISNWLALASLGIGPSLNVRGGQLIANKKFTLLNKVVNSAFWGQLLLSIIILIVTIYLSVNPYLVIGTSVFDESIGCSIFFILTGFIIGFIMQPLNGLLVANKQVHIDNYLKFGTLALRTILTVVFLNLGYGVFSLALSSFIAMLLMALITIKRIFTSFPYINLSINLFNKHEFKGLLKTGIWLTVGGIAGVLIFRMDAFLISKYFTLEMVTCFVISAKLYAIADMIHQQFFNQTRPYFVQIISKKETEKLLSLYRILFSSAFTSAAIMGFFILILNEWFINKWVGADFYLGKDINLWLCINFIIQAAVLPNRIILVSAFYKVKNNAIQRLIEGVVKFTLGIMLIPVIGLKALIIAAVITSVLFSNIYLNKLTSDFLGQKSIRNSLSLLLIAPILLLMFTDSHIMYGLIISTSCILVLSTYIITIRNERAMLAPIYNYVVNKLYKKKT